MKKICLTIGIVSIYFLISTKCNAQNAKPEQIYSIVKVDKPASYFKEQSELWKKEIDKNSKNANAWYNYYHALRYYNMTADTISSDFRASISKKLDDILNQMEKKVSNSYEYNLLKYDNAVFDFSLFPYLKKVYDMDPDRIDAFGDLAAYYAATGDTASLKKIIIKWYGTNDFSPGIIGYNFNSLMPLDKNAIFIVNGDNIVFPDWALQYAMGIRSDVKIIVTSFLQINSYKESLFKELKIEPFKKNLSDFSDENKFVQAIVEYLTQEEKERSIYFAVTTNSAIMENLKDNLYSEGLAYKYSKEKYDNIAVLIRNYEKIFLKDYLNYSFSNDVSQSIVNLSNLNYIPAFLTLYEHYKTSAENDKANEIKTQIYNIVEKSKYKEIYLKYIKEELGEK